MLKENISALKSMINEVLESPTIPTAEKLEAYEYLMLINQKILLADHQFDRLRKLFNHYCVKSCCGN